MDYHEFIERKTHVGADHGFEPTWMPDKLFPFQVAITEWACRKGRAAIFADCGLGKGQPGDSLILTPDGWKKLCHLNVGDHVITSNGSSAPVTGIYPKNEQDTYRVHFSDGSSFVVDLDHLHICRTNNDRQRGRKWRVMSTAELLSKNLRYGAGGKSRNYDIPIVGDVEFSGDELPIDPYLIGVLLGDGYLDGNISISTADDELVIYVKEALPEGVKLIHSDNYDWKIKTGPTGNRRHPFRQSLFDLGMIGTRSNNKRIPQIYLFARPKDRLEILRGLMDTDGYISKDGCCQFYSVSKQLADDVVHIVRSLGGVPTCSLKQTSCNGKKGQPCYVVTFSLARHNPFRLTRKAERWNSNPRDNGRWIDRIEFEGRQRTICISVYSPDSSYVTENFIVTHNTFMQLVWAENVCRQTNGRVLILTPLAVAFQTMREGEKIGAEVTHRREGIKPGDRIVVTNYERLHYFQPEDFQGVVCDESSILKNFDGSTRKQITDFMSTRPYRLLCTATAAPNDYVELGTSAEALGVMEYRHMLSMFFTHDGSDTSRWRLKGHARSHLFWRWVCSWARAFRSPSDVGFEDNAFKLPELIVRDHIVSADRPMAGYLFDMAACGLEYQRKDLRRTMVERCEMAAELINAHNRPAVAWCHLNDEGHMLERLINGAVEVEGADSEEFKEEVFQNFASGKIRVIVSKPTIAGFGLNWQHCAHATFFPSHSYEQYYQAMRRCWRFGQKHPVTVDLITTDGQFDVKENLMRKSEAAAHMFDQLVALMWKEIKIERKYDYSKKVEVPSWL